MQLEPTEETLVALTHAWTGDRFPGGRPRVPDDVLHQMSTARAEHAWLVLDRAGYPRQFTGGWRETHPGQTIVGGR